MDITAASLKVQYARLMRFPCVHPVATTPAQRLGVLPAYSPSRISLPRIGLSHRPFRGLRGVHSRYGLHTRAVTVFRDTLHRRLQPFRYLHSCSELERTFLIPWRRDMPRWLVLAIHLGRRKSWTKLLVSASISPRT